MSDFLTEHLGHGNVVISISIDERIISEKTFNPNLDTPMRVNVRIIGVERGG